MVTPSDQNFLDYKRAEKKALELLAEMKAVTPKKVEVLKALEAFERFFENAQQAGSGFDIAG